MTKRAWLLVLVGSWGCAGYASPEQVAGRGSSLSLPEQAAPSAEEATAKLVCSGPPGLYVEGSCTKPADGVLPYQPAYELWSDGAEKERFVYLPPGTTIDTSNPDRWAFPVGTRLYKTFALAGKRLETRLIEKVSPAPGVASWTFASYAWSEDQRAATLAPAAGVPDALGTSHDIPSQAQCRTCHSLSASLDAINGFGAIQLNHPGPGVTLRALLREERLANGASGTPNVTLEGATIPGDETAQAALGYVHANCGNCHGGPTPRAGLSLWSQVGTANVSDTAAFKTAVCQLLTVWRGRVNAEGLPYLRRIDAGHADTSGIVGRMSVRGTRDQMPPIGTELLDADGLVAVSNWIDDLPEGLCAQ